MDAASTDMLTAALAAYDAGLCVVRAATDGTKKPLGQWKQYQEARPSRDQVAQWFRSGHAGIGVICGAVSGDLEMFEIEGRMMADEGSARFSAAMRAAGLELLLKRLISGLMVASPSDGRHFYYRVIDGEATGNTKLAHDADSNTLIETRGEGGFAILAPSHGPVHPTGKPWQGRGGGVAAIPAITVAERDALFAVRRRPLTQGPIERRSETVAATHAEANGIDLIIDTNITRSTKA